MSIEPLHVSVSKQPAPPMARFGNNVVFYLSQMNQASKDTECFAEQGPKKAILMQNLSKNKQKVQNLLLKIK